MLRVTYCKVYTRECQFHDTIDKLRGHKSVGTCCEHSHKGERLCARSGEMLKERDFLFLVPSAQDVLPADMYNALLRRVLVNNWQGTRVRCQVTVIALRLSPPVLVFVRGLCVHSGHRGNIKTRAFDLTFLQFWNNFLITW